MIVIAQFSQPCSTIVKHDKRYLTKFNHNQMPSQLCPTKVFKDGQR